MPRKKTTNDESTDLRDQLGGRSVLSVNEFISTGSTILDFAIANRKDGGIPVGRITEIAGNEATGKSLLSYHIMANTQKNDGIAIYVDMERSADETFMKRMGVDVTKNFIYPSPPKSIEDFFDYMTNVITVVRTRFPNKEKKVTIVWDSVASTPAKEQIENKFSDKDRIASAARAMSACLPKAMDMFDLGYVTLVCINQLRQNIGAMPFAEQTTTPHGKSLPFYSSTRIKLRSVGKIKESSSRDSRIIGVNASAKVVKNRCGPPHRTAEFPIYFDWGVEDELSWIDFLKDTGHIVTKGAWSTLNMAGEHKFQGTEKFKQLLKDDRIRSGILDAIEETMVIRFDKKPDDVVIDAISDSESASGELV